MTENHIASLDVGSGKVIAALAHIKPNKQIEIIGLLNHHTEHN